MNGNDLIRVISFNLKRDFGLPLNRSHKWSERRALAAQYIRESGATIIGVQELLPSGPKATSTATSSSKTTAPR